MDELQTGIWLVLVIEDLWTDRGLLAHANWLSWQKLCQQMMLNMAVVANHLKKPIHFSSMVYCQCPSWLNEHHFYVNKMVYGHQYRLVEQRIVVMMDGKLVARFRMNEQGCKKAILLAGKLAFSRWKEYLS